MRGSDDQNGSLFSYVSLEERIPSRHPLRKIREIVNAALVTLDGDFAQLYADEGRPSIAPERLLRASLVQILFSIRSERQLMEQLQYNLLFRCFAVSLFRCFAGSWASASTIPCGSRRCSRRTATGC